MTTFTIIAIKHSFDWGSVCVVSPNKAWFQEEKKLGWDRLGAPKTFRRVIDLKPGDQFEAKLVGDQLKAGDILSWADLEAETSLWGDWQ